MKHSNILQASILTKNVFPVKTGFSKSFFSMIAVWVPCHCATYANVRKVLWAHLQSTQPESQKAEGIRRVKMVQTACKYSGHVFLRFNGHVYNRVFIPFTGFYFGPARIKIIIVLHFSLVFIFISFRLFVFKFSLVLISF